MDAIYVMQKNSLLKNSDKPNLNCFSLVELYEPVHVGFLSNYKVLHEIFKIGSGQDKLTQICKSDLKYVVLFAWIRDFHNANCCLNYNHIRN